MSDTEIAALLEKGAESFQKERYVEAAAFYSDVLELTKSARALGNRSACRAKLGKFDEALADATEACTLDTSNAKLRARMGAALEGLRRYEESAEAYEIAAKLDPANASYAEAIVSLKQKIASGTGIASKKSRDAYYFEQSIGLAKAAMQKEQFHEALRHYDKAVNLCPNVKELAILYSNRSVAHFKLGSFEKAESDAQSSIDCDPTYARAHLRLAMSCERLHKLDDALVQVDECLRIDNTNSQAASLREVVVAALERRNQSAAEQEAAQAAKVKTIENTRDLERQAVRANAPVHASSYLHCNFCNEYGHSRADCPLRRKRSRD